MRGLLYSLLFLCMLACAEDRKEATPPPGPLSPMPEALTNSAVVAFEDQNQRTLYLFGGLGESKTYEDITLHAFAYDLEADTWSALPPLPDTLGKIASAASVIGDKVYVAGGYHVFPDGHELSSNKIHVYEPAAGTWLPDTKPIPVAIDDHVQAVYRDSLLYLVSGWHDTANVNIVQIYDPAHDTWQQGTPLPDTPAGHVFGASGIILGDTIYMAGGAGNRQNRDFPLQGVFTKGYIHPDDPTTIDWQQIQDPHARIYRSAPVIYQGKVMWVGGAADSYNYNGISYRKKPVSPRQETLVYDPATGQLSVSQSFLAKRMDLRGIAAFNEEKIYIAGGMKENQMVSDSLFILTK